jgi:Reverse transcriptase (RNA-dependent DNA polymerase)
MLVTNGVSGALEKTILNFGCYISNVCVSIILYADDIMLITPSSTGSQRLLTICEEQLILLDMRINVNKSVCIPFGHWYNENCVELTSLQGGSMTWIKSCHYLGVYLESKFFRAFNALYSKIDRAASEDVVLALLRTKCLPILLYSTEACPVLSRDKHSIDFAITRVEFL